MWAVKCWIALNKSQRVFDVCNCHVPSGNSNRTDHDTANRATLFAAERQCRCRPTIPQYRAAPVTPLLYGGATERGGKLRLFFCGGSIGLYHIRQIFPQPVPSETQGFGTTYKALKPTGNRSDRCRAWLSHLRGTNEQGQKKYRKSQIFGSAEVFVRIVYK